MQKQMNGVGIAILKTVDTAYDKVWSQSADQMREKVRLGTHSVVSIEVIDGVGTYISDKLRMDTE